MAGYFCQSKFRFLFTKNEKIIFRRFWIFAIWIQDNSVIFVIFHGYFFYDHIHVMPPTYVLVCGNYFKICLHHMTVLLVLPHSSRFVCIPWQYPSSSTSRPVWIASHDSIPRSSPLVKVYTHRLRGAQRVVVFQQCWIFIGIEGITGVILGNVRLVSCWACCWWLANPDGATGWWSWPHDPRPLSGDASSSCSWRVEVTMGIVMGLWPLNIAGPAWLHFYTLGNRLYRSSSTRGRWSHQGSSRLSKILQLWLRTILEECIRPVRWGSVWRLWRRRAMKPVSRRSMVGRSTCGRSPGRFFISITIFTPIMSFARRFCFLAFECFTAFDVLTLEPMWPGVKVRSSDSTEMTR